jgi:hypothetical protein
MTKHEKAWRRIQRIQGSLVTDFWRTHIEERRRLLNNIVSEELNLPGNDFVMAIVQVFQDQPRVYTPKILQQMLVGRGKQFLVSEVSGQSGKNFQALLDEHEILQRGLAVCQENLEHERGMLTEHVLSRKFTFRSLVPYWEAFIQLQSQLAETKNEIDILRSKFARLKGQMLDRVSYERRFLEYPFLEQLRPLIVQIYETLDLRIQAIEDMHKLLVTASNDGLTRIREALEFVTAQNAFKTQSNTSVLNFLFLIAAIAEIIGLLQLSRQNLQDNLSIATELGVITLSTAFVLIIGISLLFRIWLWLVDHRYTRTILIRAKQFSRWILDELKKRR